MIHRKKLHIEIVPQCSKEESCQFGNLKCWYIHSIEDGIGENYDTQNNPKNDDLLEKLFDMVEKLQERILTLEIISKKMTNDLSFIKT